MAQKATDTLVPAACVAQVVDAFSDDLVVEHLAAHMNCSELDAFADLLEALGRKETADKWRQRHDADDVDAYGSTVDPGEPHYKGDDAGALITTF